MRGGGGRCGGPPHLGDEPDWDKGQRGENQGNNYTEKLGSIQAAWAAPRTEAHSRVRVQGHGFKRALLPWERAGGKGAW
jgi:hypothetical protein